jgi:hypothetical protein
MSEQQDKWDEKHGKVSAAIEEWRREHPEATLTEKEGTVDGRVEEMSRWMVEDLGRQERTADLHRLATLLLCFSSEKRTAGSLAP